jgi:hypothetical protein
MGKLSMYRALIKPLLPDQRKVVIAEVTPAVSAEFNFFLLVVLSFSIASEKIELDTLPKGL